MCDLIFVCVVLRYVFGGCAEEGQEQRTALAGPGDQQHGKAVERCKRNAGPSCSAFCFLF